MSSLVGGSGVLGVGDSVGAAAVVEGFEHPFEEVEPGVGLLRGEPSPDVSAVSPQT